MKRTTVFDNYELLGKSVLWWRRRIQNIIAVACLAVVVIVTVYWFL